MCIRDSTGPQQREVVGIEVVGDEGQRLDTGVRERRDDPGIAAAHGVDPVSYTHLRAHETVLDLVCRLLLAKKKKKINTNTITFDSV